MIDNSAVPDLQVNEIIQMRGSLGREDFVWEVNIKGVTQIGNSVRIDGQIISARKVSDGVEFE